jgi:FKBP-type peptidyl-prolyl cis-trans isomerase 2
MPKDGDVVSVHYHGTLDSGEVFDSSREREPLKFTVGAGQVISGFDELVRDLEVGGTAKRRLEASESYGERRDDLIGEVQRANAPDGLAPGGRIQLSNGQPAVVLEVTDDIVRIDANHPLAGQALTFEIELVAID